MTNADRSLTSYSQTLPPAIVISLSLAMGGGLSGIIGVRQAKPHLAIMGFAVTVPSLMAGMLAWESSRKLNQALQSIQQEKSEGDRRYSEGLRLGRERWEEEFPQLLSKAKDGWKEEQKYLLDNLNDKIKRLTDEREKLIKEAKNQRDRHWQNIVDKKDKEIRKLKEKIEVIVNEEIRLSNFKNQLDMKEQTLKNEINMINSEKLLLAREEGQRELIQERIGEKQQRIYELEEQIRKINQEYQEALRIQYLEGYEVGTIESANQHQTEIQKLQLANQKLTLKLKELETFKEMDRKLPTLKDILLKSKKPLLKPTFLTGSQGSGKAMTAANIMDIWREGASDIIPFCLDISEGGSEQSSWHRLGIPCTSDRMLFLEVCRALLAQLNPTSSLPFRNNRDEYRQAPPIVLLVDEVMTAFDGMESELINELVSIFEAIESRGSKRKVFIILMALDSQIQNLSAHPKKGGKIKLINSGKVRNYLRILLNDSLIAHATEEELKANLGLRQYLNVYGGSHFISAVQWIDGKGQYLKPIKHPSHHGHLLHETIPSQGVKSVDLASCPAWLPSKAKAIYSYYLIGRNKEENFDSMEACEETSPPKSDPKIGGSTISTPANTKTPKALIDKERGNQHAINSLSTVQYAITCPQCGSENITRNGKSRGKQRFICKNSKCKTKTFTVK